MIQKPWCCKLEFSQACNLSCDFCPISTIGSKPIHATVAFAKRLGDQLADITPECRVEIAGRGEPTLCPDLLEVLRELDKRIPKAHLCLFTNGIRLVKEPELAQQMFDAGLNILSIDCYHGTWNKHKAAMEKAGHTVKHFNEFSAYRKHPRGHKTKTVVLVPDIADADDAVLVRSLHNCAGAVDPEWYAANGPKKELPLNKGCAHPFREITVNSDGDVNFCCVDWRQQVKLGNIMNTTIRKMWNSKKRIKLLTRLYNKDRNFKPCVACDFNGGYRLGLIPNPEED